MNILTGGLGRTETADALRALALDGVEITVSNDLEAARRLTTGGADYYLGTCHTGAGASLGVLVGLLGQGTCHTFGRSVPTETEVGALLADGKRVFGFSLDRIDAVAPAIGRAIAAARA
ncbi:DUF2620 domain-containing protein [Streptomyces clavuligerus]|uniref:DUF2620 domain-containing protein n=1 Tax=Streptomyces clavuligerus TaxID=1901 RepID=E2Q191_STRCL|nr:DUF2620 domain-containing protein [Streptomyces clavuligerus]ANW18732.1 hypothetical protein BB341_11070 [Streptomyces clavuligerus]AXU13298.1 DUF2620 domain-containing protein [Streptomyces clavuligerus]EFG08596.1 Hypothetical protein SCLAV_3524 [Streptomyces clavuligerus]MBY6303250.1 DUF2620 domain-containing protein [Streptomyces clavuligerus]QCS06082.1 DUF2620 domain-containing protein [Streptomyces clavuligerus]